MSEYYLSIIIPVYNEEHRLSRALDGLFSFLEEQAYTYEVLLVENGSDDHTFAQARSYARRYPQLRVLQEQERGKGLAVRRGMLEARGKYRFMCDIDFSMPVEQINHFLPPALEDYDIAMASREAPGAVRYGEPVYRHLIGRAFNLLIRMLALPEYHDTQCGFKCFRGSVVDDLFGCQTIKGWTFDVEVLFIARRRGYKIVEVPIPWFFNPESKVQIFRDSFKMAIDLMRIWNNANKGLYRECSRKD